MPCAPNRWCARVRLGAGHHRGRAAVWLRSCGVNLLDIGRIAGGLLLLVAGGEALVRGSGALAARLGIPPLVVGLTVVSLATSAPELAVTAGAVLGGEPELAVGNVVGSNIANILLVLGVTALVTPVLVGRGLLRVDLPVMLGLSLLTLALSLDGSLGALDGALLLLGLVAQMAVAVQRGLRSSAQEEEVAALRPGRAALAVLAGVALLVVGAGWLVDGAVGIATHFGVNQLVVGLTVVAIGTSLPELAASVVAVRRGQVDLAVGNAVGSNIANLGLVLGLPALLGGGIPVPAAALALDLPVMIAVALALLAVATTRMSIDRIEGGVFVALYAAYTGYAVLAATDHDSLTGWTGVLGWVVLPALTLVAIGDLIRSRRLVRESRR